MESKPVDFSKEYDTSILKGRTALVTGGASGMGLCIATALAEAGAHVTLADINPTDGEAAAKALQQKGLPAIFIQTNVTNWDSQLAAFTHALTTSPTKTVDIAVPAAGIKYHLDTYLPTSPNPQPTTTTPPYPPFPPKPPTLTLDVNLTGTYYTLCLALHHFTLAPPHPAKQLLFISSLAGYAGETTPALLTADYTASKFGVRGLFYDTRKPSLAPALGGGGRGLTC